MKDVKPTPGEERPFECFECGNVIVAKDNPEPCPDCGGSMRNRQMPIE